MALAAAGFPEAYGTLVTESREEPKFSRWFNKKKHTANTSRRENLLEKDFFLIEKLAVLCFHLQKLIAIIDKSPYHDNVKKIHQ
ncbi:hypothetical protein N0824_04162 [Microcystis sp. 0824]|uniref:hypothetical protein n=1 Tax=Microcystis sp. 0824 TaxID=1502726 RepID=UPI000D0C4B05|nr:hypothetical protein [Microcystis sp. 0824]GBF56273.1 hypothetical protein N0824_04162 [Microcystis sp. 0824]